MIKEYLFTNSKILYEKLVNLEFTKKDNIYYKELNIIDNFILKICIDEVGIKTELIDNKSGEEYFLHKSLNATGEFNERIKSKYDEIIANIKEEITESIKLSNENFERIKSYIFNKYEVLGENVFNEDDSLVYRIKGGKKWFMLAMFISLKKLVPNSTETGIVLNLKHDQDDMDNVIDNAHVFRAYHMNKKMWLSIIIDSTVDLETAYKLIDRSYYLVQNNKK